MQQQEVTLPGFVLDSAPTSHCGMQPHVLNSCVARTALSMPHGSATAELLNLRCRRPDNVMAYLTLYLPSWHCSPNSTFNMTVTSGQRSP